MAQKKRGLGRGLDALLGNSPERKGKPSEQVSDSVDPADSLETGHPAAR